jgi:hypothetical protein
MDYSRASQVDRVACPWLIKKFVDPQAEFLFVPADSVMEVADREKAIPFDDAGSRAWASRWQVQL